MTLPTRIGIDVGDATPVAETMNAVVAAGADMVRLHFPLGDLPTPDDSYIDGARAAIREARRKGLQALAVIDGQITVAPGGMGAFGEEPHDALAAAWREEFLGNTGVLANAIGDLVTAWEVLPAPNAGTPGRIAPRIWASLLQETAELLRQRTPGALIVSGGLVSNDADDGIDYLREVYRVAAASGLWPAERAPFDIVGLQFDLLGDGGPSEEAVSAAVSERTRRLWRALEQLSGQPPSRPGGIYVTAVSWDAERAGEDVQARNLAGALAALATHDFVGAAVWCGLTDGDDLRRGLYAGQELADDARRQAWHAFRSTASALVQQKAAPTTGAALLSAAQAIPPSAVADHPPSVPAIPERASSAAPPAPAVPAMPERASSVAPPAPAAPAAPTSARRINLRVPAVSELLAAQGLDPDTIDAALAHLRARYGEIERLAPGDYEIDLGAAAPEVAITNQRFLEAMYEVGGHSWALFERSGLRLSEWTARRSEPYDGPPLDELPGLTPAERDRIKQIVTTPR
jgi:hypothetical protein